VLRKLLIVARVAGMVMESTAVSVKLLLSGEGWRDGGIEDFMSKTRELGKRFVQQRTSAIEQGRYLCFLGSVSRESATAGLSSVTPASVSEARTAS
jgi:hypothetical protein